MAVVLEVGIEATIYICSKINVEKTMINYNQISKIEFISIIYADIPSSKILDLISFTKKSKSFWQNTLEITTRMLEVFLRENQKLNPCLSERVLKIEQVFRLGEIAFDDISTFNKWIEKPSTELENNKPKDMMKTFTGLTLLTLELERRIQMNLV